MSAIDPRLGDFARKREFAEMVGRSTRTVTRWINEPDGLPFIDLGNETLIPMPQARDWLAAKIKKPNPRRAR